MFLSYSHADAVWAQRFQVMLTPLVRTQRLALWIDDRSPAGGARRGGTRSTAAIARSRVALLLVSEHYLASAFINDHELPALIEQGVRVGAGAGRGLSVARTSRGWSGCSGCTTRAGTVR